MVKPSASPAAGNSGGRLPLLRLGACRLKPIILISFPPTQWGSECEQLASVCTGCCTRHVSVEAGPRVDPPELGSFRGLSGAAPPCPGAQPFHPCPPSHGRCPLSLFFPCYFSCTRATFTVASRILLRAATRSRTAHQFASDNQAPLTGPLSRACARTGRKIPPARRAAGARCFSKRPPALDRLDKETIVAVTSRSRTRVSQTSPIPKVHPRFLNLHARVVLFEALAKPYLALLENFVQTLPCHSAPRAAQTGRHSVFGP